ncbi:GNAT family N-acetyltransferase [Bradyrhizobium sp. CW9]|uniref:GNAT family N-acetyltransferase n=1 Tax=Bradyrhizobium sp. CW9 TaxID=2782689 RepID=UPI001FFBA1D3|nr:GNAT family N-acetyltransferase [Bradyrhizobium sp. CW9]MCK1332500.1 GNAT family N-acetyltransferase [Bradyrhizobium sp. CW9]
MQHEVRPLRVGDLPSVTEIYSAACRARESTQGMHPWSVEEMKEFLFGTPPSFESYTCTDNGAVIGWTALTRHHFNEGVKHTAEMSLYVSGAFRRKGVGSALAHAVLSRASALNLHCVLAMVFNDSLEAVSFAQGECGFSIAGCLPEAFPGSGRNCDILVLEKLVVPWSR